jgi:hypothetical protein
VLSQPGPATRPDRYDVHSMAYVRVILRGARHSIPQRRAAGLAERLAHVHPPDRALSSRANGACECRGGTRLSFQRNDTCVIAAPRRCVTRSSGPKAHCYVDSSTARLGRGAGRSRMTLRVSISPRQAAARAHASFIRSRSTRRMAPQKTGASMCIRSGGCVDCRPHHTPVRAWVIPGLWAG